MIPKIIHQIWIGPKTIPKKYMDTWKSLHPDWEYMLWTDETIKQKYPKGFKNQKHINEIEEWAGKADIMRYEILHKYGGFYADADSICVNKLDDFFLDRDSFAGFENEEVRGNLIANGYIGAIKGCKLMNILINKISKLSSVSQKTTGKMAWQNVGPLFFTNTIVENEYPISIFPSHLFIPEHYSGVTYKGSDKIYARQLWGSTRELSNPNFYNDLSKDSVPKVSILIPIYKIKDVNWFRQCIHSIDGQSFKEFEVVIVNDGSPQEDVISYLNELSVRPNYKIIHLEKNVGVGLALNAGIKECYCDLIARMDADDIMFDYRIKDQYDYMISNSDVDMVGGSILYFTKSEGGRIELNQNSGAQHPEIITKTVAKSSFWYVNHPTVMFRKERIQKLKGYKNLKGLPEDYELWTRMINANMKIRNISKPLLAYRLSSDQASKGSEEKMEFLRKIQATIK